MQSALIQRYLGNKSTMSRDIVNVITELADPGDLVFDAFSGSLAVSAALREAGFRIACNDINYFSWVYARAFFSTAELPWPNGERRAGSKEEAWQTLIDELVSPYPADFPPDARRTDIFDHYCEDGRASRFVSRRGTWGRRRFFSAANARAIDRALSRLRHRHCGGALDEHTRCLLTACLLNGVEKVSNTQGTFHDFPRNSYDPRALRPIRLHGPREAFVTGLPSEHIGKARDSLEYVVEVPTHKVMYLDPPYNFRQYTSYYFMLNLLSSYSEIDDLDQYFAGIEFVRGQNMDDDFTSTFCSKPGFIDSLELLIARANCDYVVLSYFDGRNHWGEFKSGKAERQGRVEIEKFFGGDLFSPSSLRCFPVTRLNYQSYGGYKAEPIQEFLFVARKAKGLSSKRPEESENWTGQLLA